MSGFNTIKKSRKRSHEIEEKLNVLNRELEKTKDIQEQPTMHTSGVIVKSEDQANQDHSDFESKSFGGEGLGFSGADGNTAGNASIGDASGFSDVALSPPHPVTGVRTSAFHVRDGLGGTTPLRPGKTTTRGFSDNPPVYTMGSCLWFYDSDFDNGAGQPAGRWCNLEYSNFDGDTKDKWFFWDTNNSGFFVVNTDLSQHPCGDISSLIDDLNFPGDGGAIGSAFNTVMTQQRLDEPDNLLIDIKDLAVQAFNYLKDRAEDFFGAFAMPVQVATSVGKNEPVNAPEPSESDIDEFFDNLDPTQIFNPDDPFNVQTTGGVTGGIPVNNDKQNYADENIYVDENGDVQSNIGPNGEKEYYKTNNTAPASEGSTIGSRGQAQSQVYQNENGQWMFSYEDHAYDNLNTTDADETESTFDASTKASEVAHRNADERFGRKGGEVQFPGTPYETKKPDNTSPNTGAMSNYPCNSTACIRGDSIQTFEIPVSEIKNQEIKNAINAAIAAGNKQNESYIPESIKLGQFEPKVLDVDIKQLRKNIKPEFPKDPPPEMIDGYSAKSRLAPKKIDREPFIKITKKDLAQNHKLTDKEISDFMNDVKMINDYIKENPADLIHAQLRYPKHDPRLAQLNWQMDQMLDASKKYVDRQFPENQNLFNKIKDKIKNTIDQTDPKNFKPVKDPIKYVDVKKTKKLKETVTRHFNKPVKRKSIFGLNMSEVRKTNQKMIEKREQEQKVKEEEKAYIQEKMSRQKSNWKDDLTDL